MANRAPNVIGKCNFLMAFPKSAHQKHKIDQNLNEPFSEVDFGFMEDYGAKQTVNVDLYKRKVSSGSEATSEFERTGSGLRKSGYCI